MKFIKDNDVFKRSDLSESQILNKKQHTKYHQKGTNQRRYI